jgi:hypothetical protein
MNGVTVGKTVYWRIIVHSYETPDVVKAFCVTVWDRAGNGAKKLRALPRVLSEMELAGLEPATSWVRSRRSPS